MTGQHIGHAHIRGNRELKNGQEPIPAETITVAEKMKEAGYATALIGKWGLGYSGSEGDPNQQGFDYFYGYNDQRRAHQHFPTYVWRNEEQVKLNNDHGKEEDYTQYLFTAEARNFIKENKENPFFLYLAYVVPHSKLQIPEEDECFTMYENEDWPILQKKHAGMITRMDRDIGTLLDDLKTMGLDKNTLVIFTSDNGPHSAGGAIPEFFNDSGPLKGIKRDMYEGGIRVPFVAWWPGVIEAGRRSDHLAAHWDLMATACDMGGVQPPKATDGISYLPLLKGELQQQKQHEYLYFELHRPTRRAVRQGDWVCLQKNTTAIDPNENWTELYNLKDDLAQEVNLSTKFPERTKAMKELLRKAHRPNPLFKFKKK
jgi:arylsulfatase A-like enzyme